MQPLEKNTENQDQAACAHVLGALHRWCLPKKIRMIRILNKSLGQMPKPHPYLTLSPPAAYSIPEMLPLQVAEFEFSLHMRVFTVT